MKKTTNKPKTLDEWVKFFEDRERKELHDSLERCKRNSNSI